MRGCCLFGTPRFSPDALLPTDPPPWASAAGSPAFDRMSFPVPSGWEWVNDWAVDMRHDVDSDGWSYATAFKSREWTGDPTQSHYVRRRVWTRNRARRRLTASFSSASASAPSNTAAAPTEDTALVLILRLPTLVRGCTLDRQRLDAIAGTLDNLRLISSSSPAIALETIPVYTVEAVLDTMLYDKSRLNAVKMMLPFLDKDGLVAAVFKITHHCNRRELLNSLEPESFLCSYLRNVQNKS
ncbi:hypothetical protein HDU83_004444 [Entophlyctis luteolus]|nr:hypothetical protein HDU83_004444 [Entophlyctis luteolus]